MFTMSMADFTKLAKESLLTSGHIEPAFFVQLEGIERTKIIIVSTGSVTQIERATAEFLSGRKFALTHPKKKVVGLGRAAEIRLRANGAEWFPQHWLEVSSINLENEEQASEYYKILDQPDQKVDLLRAEAPGAVSLGLLALPLFLRGMRTAKQPQNIVIHEARRMLEKFKKDSELK